MTADERDRLRTLIDQARRQRLSREARVEETTSQRRGYMADYHQANRDRRLAQGRARRQRLKDAA